MPIRFTCPGCGRKLRVAEEAAGQRVNCPGCQAALLVPFPAAAPEAGEILDAQSVEREEDIPLAALDESSPEQGERRPCSACGYMIAVRAAKCRFCGEVFDPELKRLQRVKRRRRQRADDWALSVSDWLVAVLCGGLGCILGVVYLVNGSPRGIKVLAISVVCAALQWFLLILLLFATHGAGE